MGYEMSNVYKLYIDVFLQTTVLFTLPCSERSHGYASAAMKNNLKTV